MRSPPPGARWTWRHDAMLIAAVLAGRHIELAMRASGYAARRCRRRIRQLMPPVPHRDALLALTAELRARARQERGHE